MKIWFIVDEFPPHYGGGIGMYVDIVSRGLSEQGHDVTVITADHTDVTEQINEHLRHIRFLRFRSEEIQKYGYHLAIRQQYYQQVMKLLQQETPPDVIEMPEYNAIGYYILQARYLGEEKLRNTRMVVHCHTPSFELQKINHEPAYTFPIYWIGQMEKFCLRAADALLTQSAFLHDHLLSYTSGQEFHVIPLPYHFQSNNIQYICGNHLLYAGRLEYRKGIWQFLPHMVRHWKAGSKTPLLLVGGDVFFSPKQQTIGEMIREKYKKWIDCGLLQLMDKVPPTELEQLMASARAVVVPSIYENYPYINVMAMANRVPVLVSRQGGQAEAVDCPGFNGFVFDWDVPDDCYRVIGELLAKTDEELVAIGENGYKRIRACCHPDTNIALRSAFYKQVCDHPCRTTPYPFNHPLPHTPLPDDEPFPLTVKGLLSVVIPYYNLGATIEETIQSVIASDYKQYEIILLDDGSTEEESIRKAAEIAATYQNVRLKRIANGGLANARNVGGKMARGEYVCFLDADDTVQPTYFSRCIRIMEEHKDIAFVYSWVQYFGGSQDVWSCFDTELPFFCGQNQLVCMAVARRADYCAFAFNHPEMAYGLEDYDGWLGMVENGRMGVCIPELLVNYRVRPASMSRTMSKEAILYLRQRLIDFHPMLYQQYGMELVRLLMENGPSFQWGSPIKENQLQVETLQAELDAIKNRRGYRWLNQAANVIYRLPLVKHLLTGKQK